MSISRQPGTRQGFIIVVTLTLMLVMMTMGIALFYSAKQTVEQVNSNMEKRSYLFTAESCITEAIQWLEINSASCTKPGTVCKTIKASNGMNKWDIGEADKRKTQMGTQGYQCQIQNMKVLNLDISGEGSNVGQGGEYAAKVTDSKYYYKITSDGFNIGGDSKTTVEIIVSLIM
jgi:Tfp pilus assembly protein PilX